TSAALPASGARVSAARASATSVAASGVAAWPPLPFGAPLSIAASCPAVPPALLPPAPVAAPPAPPCRPPTPSGRGPFAPLPKPAASAFPANRAITQVAAPARRSVIPLHARDRRKWSFRYFANDYGVTMTQPWSTPVTVLKP